ncbi:HlyD family efflux transporter periplasmic adaptor subunit [Magnetococcales bacterium HHB-1]
MAKTPKVVRSKHAQLVEETRHPIKAARLLYSAPPWVLRGPIHIIAMIVIASMAYSFWAKKDEIVYGRLSLERESTTMEAISDGIVFKIHAKEGETVTTGTPLIEIRRRFVTEDSVETKLAQELGGLDKEIDNIRREYQAKFEDLDQRKETIISEIDHKITQLETSKESATKNRKVLLKKLASARKDINYRKKKLSSAQATLGKDRRLFNKGVITEPEYRRSQARVDDRQKALDESRTRVDTLELELQALSEEQINREVAQQKKRKEDKLEEIKRKHALITKRQNTDIERLEGRKKDLRERLDTIQSGRHLDWVKNVDKTTTRYTSKFSGVITEIHVKQGAIIGPGASLISMVRDSATLQAKTLVQNRDIGQINANVKAKRRSRVNIKYDAYPYQEYGIATGTIAHVSAQPVRDASGKRSMYEVRINLDKDFIQSSRLNAPREPLVVGLEGNAEIKTGEKRFIELLFSPISRFFDGYTGEEEE